MPESVLPATDRVPVLLPLPLDGAYDYRVAGGNALPPGTFVRVPLGRREVVGVVWGAGDGTLAEHRLKSVIERLDAPPMAEPLRRFVDWVAAYTLSPVGNVLRMAMSVPAALEPPSPIMVLTLGEGAVAKATKARARVLALLAEGPPRAPLDIAREASVGPAVLRAMVKAGALRPVALPRPLAFAAPEWRRPGHMLSPAQAVAAETLEALVRRGGYSATLLDGVTGSGKTEVYLAAVAAALAAGRQALVLLPEIALTPRVLDRFVERFGVRPAVWHSELAPRERQRAWRAIATGEARVVVGARSALFLPVAELGLIVVDEEQDGAYKQEDGVAYHARDMAVVRANLAGCPIVLASATPALETIVNVERGRYGMVHLPERIGGATLPRISLIDLRRDPPERQQFLAPPLVAALTETFAAGEQALLFLNRRGYAPLTLCRACGHRIECPDCTAWLVEHRSRGNLLCHHCGYQTPAPPACPSCGAVGALAPCGPGVERIAEEAAARFPSARIALMTSDTISGPAAAEALLDRVAARDVDLLIGTQMTAKGHHFPLMTLVGVVDADLGLGGGDLRASERTFQLLHQVAGRAGRAERVGRVLLQTYCPEHRVMQALAAGDRDGFLKVEAELRREGGWPPFGRLAAVILSGVDAGAVERVAESLARAAPRGDEIIVLGPAPAPLAVLRGRHRRRFLVKAGASETLHRRLSEWLALVEAPANVRIQVDIDPYSFL